MEILPAYSNSNNDKTKNYQATIMDLTQKAGS